MNPIIWQMNDITTMKKEKKVNQVILNILLRYTFNLMQTIKWGKKNQHQEKKKHNGQ